MQQRQALGHDCWEWKRGLARSGAHLIWFTFRIPGRLPPWCPFSPPQAPSRGSCDSACWDSWLYTVANCITSILEEKKEKTLSVRLILWSNLLSHSSNFLITVLKMSVNQAERNRTFCAGFSLSTHSILSAVLLCNSSAMLCIFSLLNGK